MSLFHLENKKAEEIFSLIERGLAFKNGAEHNYGGKKVITTLFFEPSTRTHYSFHVAAKRLGMEVVDFKADQSSLIKGETFIDTIKTFASFDTDMIVIRHPEKEYYKQLEDIGVPIVNGGDGSGNHPTQALLDLMTIYEHYGYLKGLKIAICGDIAHSRVARTNYQIMQELGMDVVFCAPKHLHADYGVYAEIDDVIEHVDIMMLLRMQIERHDTELSIDNYNALYGLNKERLGRLRKDAIIMHPAPFNINIELTEDVFEDERCKIFEQSKNGVYMRMAVIENELN